MIRIETRNQVKELVKRHPDGISLSELHAIMHRIMTRLQLRTILRALYMNEEVSRERVSTLNHRITKYYPFNGNKPVKRKFTRRKEESNGMLSMKDFMPGKKYQAYIEL